MGNDLTILNNIITSNSSYITGINSLILIALSFGIPFISIVICSFFKIKLIPVTKMYLYAFTTGLLIILGSVGFIKESIEHLNESSKNGDMDYLGNSITQIVVKTAVVLSGAILGIISIFLIRWLTFKNKKEIHKSHFDHNHNDHMSNYSDIDNESALKKNGLILLLSHRIVDGISLGILTSGSTTIGSFESWGMIISFIIHLIPTTIIIYLRQVDIYRSRKKALFNSFWMLLINIPFTLIGSFCAYGIQYIYWLMPLLFSFSGTIMVILSIIEIIPEFIHNKEMKTKKWYLAVLMLAFGILLGILLLSLHHH